MQLGIEHKVRAVSLTIAIFAIIVGLLLYIRFRTPIPPYPEDGGQGLGIEINLGNYTSVESTIEANPENQQKAENDKILTQDIEEADVIQHEERKQNQKKINTKKIEKPVEPQPVINEKALFKKKNIGESVDNGASGSFGNNQSKGSGIGEGSGTGQGKGTGTGIGDGISFSLDGRSALSLVKPQGDFQTSGKVVVEITVDKNGNVINAIPGVKGSTTLDEYLLQIARDAAMASKFSPQPNASIQKGTITYRFVLQ